MYNLLDVSIPSTVDNNTLTWSDPPRTLSYNDVMFIKHAAPLSFHNDWSSLKPIILNKDDPESTISQTCDRGIEEHLRNYIIAYKAGSCDVVADVSKFRRPRYLTPLTREYAHIERVFPAWADRLQRWRSLSLDATAEQKASALMAFLESIVVARSALFHWVAYSIANEGRGELTLLDGHSEDHRTTIRRHPQFDTLNTSISDLLKNLVKEHEGRCTIGDLFSLLKKLDAMNSSIADLTAGKQEAWKDCRDMEGLYDLFRSWLGMLGIDTTAWAEVCEEVCEEISSEEISSEEISIQDSPPEDPPREDRRSSEDERFLAWRSPLRLGRSYSLSELNKRTL